MPLNLSVPEVTELTPRISVFGVGGAGGNAVNNMIESSLGGVEFVVANTDAQALGLSKTATRIQLGEATTQGLGAGSLPEIGAAAAEESLEQIVDQIGDSHMLFITAGMGGGTGTGAAPVIAKAAKERDVLTVGVVTKPFHFEGARRMKIAQAGIEELQKHVDTLLIIPNQNLFSIANERTTFHEAFALADQVLHSGVRGITDLMVMPGLINLDFNDVRTVMSEMGKAMMGTGEAEGDKRAIEAAEAAISNPLLDEVSMKGAKGVLINITGSMDMTLFEVDEAANRIRSEVDPEANIIVGSTFNQDLEGRVRVSVVATGIESAKREASGFQPRQSVSVSISRPWRETEQAPAAEQPDVPVPPQPAQPAQPELPASVGASYQQAPAPHQQSLPEAAPVPAAAVNPVGDVHERIRRMLTEGPRGDDADNPFRSDSDQGQAETGKSAIGAALDMFKPRSARRRGETEQAVPAGEPEVRKQPSGDLFHDGEEGELEIPSFLRKKKVG
ncbi:MAG: cell division protein FtsZ [Parvularculaceae bacterium]|nr:MAG: cell division protein FtsZ [Parvularculaceae bacterium]